jgi:hypothetical protein
MENPLYKQGKLKKQKILYLGCFAALLLCSLEVIVWAGHSISQTVPPDGWPTRLDKRKLYSTKYGFVYAGRKSAAIQVNRLFGTIVKELDENSIKKATTGLILVMDTKEKPLFRLQRIIEVVRQADKQQQSDESKNALKSIIEAKDKIQEQGMDLDLLLSIAPIPIEPNLLPQILNEFPKDLAQQIDFCVIIPTARNIQNGMRKIIKAAIKKQKIGILERIVLLPLMPFIENKVVDAMKKARQLVLYHLLLDKQEGLSKKQKEDKVKAYKKKLGLGKDGGPNPIMTH